MAAASTDSMVCVAQVSAAHGVRGALKLRCFTEEPENVAAYGPLCDAHGRELFRLTVLNRIASGLIVRAEGIETRDAAEALKGMLLFVPRTRLPEPGADEFYHEDLIGLVAVDRSGLRRGEVIGIHNFGAGDVVEIKDGAQESFFVPFTSDAVPEIDLPGGRVVIDPPALS